MNENYQAGSEIFFEPPVRKDGKYYRSLARERLKGSFWKFLLTLLILTACAALICGGVFWGMMALMSFAQRVGAAFALVLVAMAVAVALLSLLLAPALVGVSRAFLRTVDGEPISVSDLRSGFGMRFGSTFLTGVLVAAVIPVALVLLAIGSLLAETALASASPLILLGALMFLLGVALLIWFAIRMAFVFQIRAEYPQLGALDSIRNSIALTKAGGKRLLALSLSFIGWYALAALVTVLTSGIGIFAFCPVIVYHQAALTLFYHDISQRDKADEVEFPSLDPEDYDPDQAAW